MQGVAEHLHGLLKATNAFLIKGLQLAARVETSKATIAELRSGLDELREKHSAERARLEPELSLAQLAANQAKSLSEKAAADLSQVKKQFELWRDCAGRRSILDRLPIIGNLRRASRARAFVSAQGIGLTATGETGGGPIVRTLEAFLKGALLDAGRASSLASFKEREENRNVQRLAENLTSFRDRSNREVNRIEARINLVSNLRSRLAVWIEDVITHFDDWHLGSRRYDQEQVRRDYLAPVETGTCRDEEILDTVERLADFTLRARMFRLAVHYWEARWLLRTEAALMRFRGLRTPRDKIHDDWSFDWVREDRWRRHAMLTPCFVCTVYMAPRIFQRGGRDGKSPMLGFLDLLIVDEAGQVSPEIGSVLLPLAKASLIVGDVHQIAPVPRVSHRMDRENLKRHLLVESRPPVANCDLSVEMLKPWSASRGSLMMMAQQASTYRVHPAFPRGMLLTEHRRCQDKIIDYCNQLVYRGVLTVATEPKLTRADRTYSCAAQMAAFYLPELGYAHVPGFSSQRARSRVNTSQSSAIADWLTRVAPVLEEKYDEPIEKIVGIITPFNAQRRQIAHDLGQAFSRASIGLRGNVRKVVVGTVHALQGAECPIVIFSPVYGENDCGMPFIDGDLSMLNVAVSRAKHSFIVFGFMEHFHGPADTPSGLLGRLLFAERENEITNFKLVRRSRFEDIPVDAHARVRHLSTLEEHRQTLVNLVTSCKRRLLIVSPWLSDDALTRDEREYGLLKALRDSKSQGRQIFIVSDEEWGKRDESAIRAAKRLSLEGVDVKFGSRIHNKTLCCDDDILIEGSFNWLSATRQEKLAQLNFSLRYDSPALKPLVDRIWQRMQERLLNTR